MKNFQPQIAQKMRNGQNVYRMIIYAEWQQFKKCLYEINASLVAFVQLVSPEIVMELVLRSVDDFDLISDEQENKVL